MYLKLFKNRVFPIIILFVFIQISCGSKSKENEVATNGQNQPDHTNQTTEPSTLVLGANRTDFYLPILNGKRVAIVANQTSMIDLNSESLHLVDFLNASKSVNVIKVFAPEHGFRGTADAGEVVKDGIDTKTGIPIVSLYGKNKKPSSQQ